MNLNSDRSLNGDTGCWAAVIKGRKGRCSQWQKVRINTPVLIWWSSRGCLKELNLTLNMVLMKASTDSLCVKYYFEMDKPPWELRKMAAKLKLEVQKLRAFSLFHHYRETNRLVDRIAATRSLLEYEEIDINSLFVECKIIVEEDTARKLCKRV